VLVVVGRRLVRGVADADSSVRSLARNGFARRAPTGRDMTMPVGLCLLLFNVI
jgi:hypothetical protein